MTSAPHIVFVLADDVGWNDWNYNTDASPIPTTFIDYLSRRGVQLKQHYMHNLCTPSRASLLTGLYHVNTGLTFVLAPGTPAGLPADIPTLPIVLKSHGNYKTAMTGKWHLGNAQRSATPTGRGFESFTGIYMWDTDSYTKQMWEVPWEAPLMVDWVKEYDNGTFHHYAEPKHATEAITTEAEEVIRQHAQQHPDQPLFLYVAYTAAHSPLQPLPRHEAACSHIPHLWRRDFCGMVVGLDEGVRNITRTLQEELGDNVILVLTSDNGGSPWFGGMNQPLRGTKATPYEGGQRVPGLIVDLTHDQRYLSNAANREDVLSLVQSAAEKQAEQAVRQYHGLMHVSDWLPTLLSYAGVAPEQWPERLDGKDFSDVFKRVPIKADDRSIVTNQDTKFFESPRSEILYEMYFANESNYGESLVSYRYKDLKLVEGIVRDENYYFEAKTDGMSYSDKDFTSNFVESFIRVGEWVLGKSQFDMFHLLLTHIHLHDYNSRQQKKLPAEALVRLYNITKDPYETVNLAQEDWAAQEIDFIRGRANEYAARRRPPQDTHKLFSLSEIWKKSLVKGDCSMNSGIKKRDCLFTHPWLDDTEDVWALPGLTTIREHGNYQIRRAVTKIGVVVVLVMFAIFVKFIRPYRRAVRMAKEQHAKKEE